MMNVDIFAGLAAAAVDEPPMVVPRIVPRFEAGAGARFGELSVEDDQHWRDVRDPEPPDDDDFMEIAMLLRSFGADTLTDGEAVPSDPFFDDEPSEKPRSVQFAPKRQPSSQRPRLRAVPERLPSTNPISLTSESLERESAVLANTPPDLVSGHEVLMHGSDASNNPPLSIGDSTPSLSAAGASDIAARLSKPGPPTHVVPGTQHVDRDPARTPDSGAALTQLAIDNDSLAQNRPRDLREDVAASSVDDDQLTGEALTEETKRSPSTSSIDSRARASDSSRGIAADETEATSTAALTNTAADIPYSEASPASTHAFEFLPDGRSLPRTHPHDLGDDVAAWGVDDNPLGRHFDEAQSPQASADESVSGLESPTHPVQASKSPNSDAFKESADERRIDAIHVDDVRLTGDASTDSTEQLGFAGSSELQMRASQFSPSAPIGEATITPSSAPGNAEVANERNVETNQERPNRNPDARIRSTANDDGHNSTESPPNASSPSGRPRIHSHDGGNDRTARSVDDVRLTSKASSTDVTHQSHSVSSSELQTRASQFSPSAPIDEATITAPAARAIAADRVHELEPPTHAIAANDDRRESTQARQAGVGRVHTRPNDVSDDVSTWSVDDDQLTHDTFTDKTEQSRSTRSTALVGEVATTASSDLVDTPPVHVSSLQSLSQTVDSPSDPQISVRGHVLVPDTQVHRTSANLPEAFELGNPASANERPRIRSADLGDDPAAWSADDGRLTSAALTGETNDARSISPSGTPARSSDISPSASIGEGRINAPSARSSAPDRDSQSELPAHAVDASNRQTPSMLENDSVTDSRAHMEAPVLRNAPSTGQRTPIRSKDGGDDTTAWSVDDVHMTVDASTDETDRSITTRSTEIQARTRSEVTSPFSDQANTPQDRAWGLPSLTHAVDPTSTSQSIVRDHEAVLDTPDQRDGRDGADERHIERHAASTLGRGNLSIGPVADSDRGYSTELPSVPFENGSAARTTDVDDDPAARNADPEKPRPQGHVSARQSLTQAVDAANDRQSSGRDHEAVADFRTDRVARDPAGDRHDDAAALASPANADKSPWTSPDRASELTSSRHAIGMPGATAAPRDSSSGTDFESVSPSLSSHVARPPAASASSTYLAKDAHVDSDVDASARAFAHDTFSHAIEASSANEAVSAARVDTPATDDLNIAENVGEFGSALSSSGSGRLSRSESMARLSRIVPDARSNDVSDVAADFKESPSADLQPRAKSVREVDKRPPIGGRSTAADGPNPRVDPRAGIQNESSDALKHANAPENITAREGDQHVVDSPAADTRALDVRANVSQDVRMFDSAATPGAEPPERQRPASASNDEIAGINGIAAIVNAPAPGDDSDMHASPSADLQPRVTSVHEVDKCPSIGIRSTAADGPNLRGNQNESNDALKHANTPENITARAGDLRVVDSAVADTRALDVRANVSQDVRMFDSAVRAAVEPPERQRPASASNGEIAGINGIAAIVDGPAPEGDSDMHASPSADLQPRATSVHEVDKRPSIGSRSTAADGPNLRVDPRAGIQNESSDALKHANAPENITARAGDLRVVDSAVADTRALEVRANVSQDVRMFDSAVRAAAEPPERQRPASASNDEIAGINGIAAIVNGPAPEDDSDMHATPSADLQPRATSVHEMDKRPPIGSRSTAADGPNLRVDCRAAIQNESSNALKHANAPENITARAGDLRVIDAPAADTRALDVRANVSQDVRMFDSAGTPAAEPPERQRPATASNDEIAGINGIAAIVNAPAPGDDSDVHASQRNAPSAAVPPQRNISISIDRIDLAPPVSPATPRRRIQPQMTLERYRDRLT